MTLGDWEKEAKSTPNDTLEKRIEAIDTLLTWDTFAQEWIWTGIRTLRTILNAELERRNRDGIRLD